MLSFIFDNLLPTTQQVGDKDTAALCRVLVASLAACNHSPETQLHLATEIKTALQRALILREISEKQSRIQSISSIIVTVIEACPVSVQSLTRLEGAVLFQFLWLLLAVSGSGTSKLRHCQGIFACQCLVNFLTELHSSQHRSLGGFALRSCYN